MRRHKFRNKDNLKRILREMPKQVRADLDEALEDGATKVTNSQRVLVAKRTGRLMRSIRVVNISNKFRLALRIIAGGEHNGVRIVYARIQEFRPGGAFFYPAVRAWRRRVKSKVTRTITKSARNTIAKHKKGR